jgi:circadian clock protein KaiB
MIPRNEPPVRDDDLLVRQVLFLYIVGNSIPSNRAIVNVRRFLEKHLKDRYELNVVDVRENPEIAAKEHVIALPTLVRKFPAPLRRFIGDLSNTDRLLQGMDLVF